MSKKAYHPSELPEHLLEAIKNARASYESYRAWYREQWAQSDEEDWCARKEVEPGTYKPIHD